MLYYLRDRRKNKTWCIYLVDLEWILVAWITHTHIPIVMFIVGFFQQCLGSILVCLQKYRMSNWNGGKFIAEWVSWQCTILTIGQCSLKIHIKQDRQCTYNVTWGTFLNHYCGGRSISITYCEYVCSLRYPACNAHAPHCHLWPAPQYNIFPHYLINSMIF
jgi:vacuolar-type H+-ATPase subunit I/STV1